MCTPLPSFYKFATAVLFLDVEMSGNKSLSLGDFVDSVLTLYKCLLSIVVVCELNFKPLRESLNGVEAPSVPKDGNCLRVGWGNVIC